MMKRLFFSASCLTFALTAPTQSLANDATIEKLTAMLEKQQAVLEAQSKELKSLQAQLKDLKSSQSEQQAEHKKVVEKIEKVEKTTVAGAPVVVQGDATSKAVVVEQGDFPGSFKIPGTNLSMKIGGQVKIDGSYTFDQTAGLSEDLLQPRTIQPGANTYGHTRFQARDTRLNVDVRGPTDYGDLRTYAEFDLFGGNAGATPQNQFNNYEIRMRHAYVSLGDWLVGQNWSTFNDPAAFAETLDFAQVNGESFTRQPQIRWTNKLDDNFKLALAIENPEGDVFDTNAGARRLSTDQIPDLIAHLRYEDDWGHLQTGGLYRQFKDDTAGLISDSASGYGVNLSGKINTHLASDKDSFRFQVNYGEGIGRYVNDLQSTAIESFDAAIDPAGNIDPLEVLAGYVSYQAVYSPKLRSNLTAGYITVDQPSYQVGGVLDNSTYIAGNIIWSPFPKIDVGLEYLWAERENLNGASGDVNRILTSVKYAF